MTIQKATASLILDGISIALQTAIGLVLLGFYHPFLLGFDIILLVMMTVFNLFVGPGWGTDCHYRIASEIRAGSLAAECYLDAYRIPSARR